MTSHARSTFWARTRVLTAVLLLLWLLINLLVPWFARELNAVQAFGFPAGYWLAAEGALLAYLLIIAVYVWRMDRLEARCLQDLQCETAETPAASGPAAAASSGRG